MYKSGLPQMISVTSLEPGHHFSARKSFGAAHCVAQCDKWKTTGIIGQPCYNGQKHHSVGLIKGIPSVRMRTVQRGIVCVETYILRHNLPWVP